MPSDIAQANQREESDPLAWLSSQGLGIVCGQTTVLLLACGSAVLAATREGVSAGIQMDDVRVFFTAPSPVHTWFYLLVPVLGLYALNTFLATWKSVAQKWRNGTRTPRAYAAPVIHVAFLVALVAHLVGGLGSIEQGQVTVDERWSELGDGREARLVNLDIAPLPDGGIKQVHASLEIRDRTGALSSAVVHYNGPLSRGFGSDLLLLMGPSAVPSGVRVAQGELRCELAVEEDCQLAGVTVGLLYVLSSERRGMGAVARLRARTTSGTEDFWLGERQQRRLSDGSLLAFEAVTTSPAIRLHRRHAPGNPWALLAAILLVLGLGLMWRRFA